MNWLIRLGQWWETRRVVRRPEFVKALGELRANQRTPSVEAKELSMLKVRLDRLELYVGLKREQAPAVVADAPRIS